MKNKSSLLAAADKLSFCGFTCSNCVIYQATQASNTKEMALLAKKYSTDAQTLTLADLHCMGCMSQSVSTVFCKDCDIRACGIKMGVEHCGICKLYPCDTLQKTIVTGSKSREILDLEHKKIALCKLTVQLHRYVLHFYSDQKTIAAIALLLFLSLFW